MASLKNVISADHENVGVGHHLQNQQSVISVDFENVGQHHFSPKMSAITNRFQPNIVRE